MALSFGFGLLSSSSSSSSLCVLPPSETHTFMMRPSASSGLRMMRTSRITCCTLSQSSKPARKIRGIMKPRKVSPEMEDLVGAPEMARTQVLKRIWAYIKDNNLQVRLPSSPNPKSSVNVFFFILLVHDCSVLLHSLLTNIRVCFKLR